MTVTLLLSVFLAAASRVQFDPFEQNEQLKAKLEFFNGKIKELQDEQKSLIEKVKANWEKRNASMNGAIDEKTGLQEGVEKLKAEYKEKEHCLQDWLDVHSKMKESVMTGLNGGALVKINSTIDGRALVKTNSTVQPASLRGPGGFRLVLRDPLASTNNRYTGSSSAALYRPEGFTRPIRNHPTATGTQTRQDLAHQDDQMKIIAKTKFDQEVVPIHADVRPGPVHVTASAQTTQGQDAEEMKKLEEEESEEEDEERVMEQEDGLKPAYMTAASVQTVQDRDLGADGWMEEPDEELDEAEASEMEDAGLEADEDIAAVNNEGMQPTQSLPEALHEDVKLDPAAAEGIMEAATSKVVNSPPPRTPVHLRGLAPAHTEVEPMHMVAQGTEQLSHQEEVMKIIDKNTVPHVDIGSVIHLAGGSRTAQDPGVDKMKIIKENDVLQQAVTMAKSDAQRLLLTNQKYTATLEAADTRTGHWKALLGRMKGTFEAQENLLKAQIAHLDQKCKEAEEIKGVPNKIKENFDSLKNAEQDVLEDIPVEPDCVVKVARSRKHKKCRSFSKKTNIGKGAVSSKRMREACKEFCKQMGDGWFRFSVGKKGQCRCCHEGKSGKYKKRPKGRWRTYKAKDCR